MEGHREKARKTAEGLLGLLRQGTEFYDPFLDRLRWAIREGRLTLSDIGSSEEELGELRKKGIIIAARKSLERLRSGEPQDENDRFVLLKGIDTELRRGRFTYSEIGTNEDELIGLWAP